jgi:hypothetical protein
MVTLPVDSPEGERFVLGMETWKTTDKRVTVCVRFFDAIRDSGGLKGADIQTRVAILF